MLFLLRSGDNESECSSGVESNWEKLCDSRFNKNTGLREGNDLVRIKQHLVGAVETRPFSFAKKYATMGRI